MRTSLMHLRSWEDAILAFGPSVSMRVLYGREARRTLKLKPNALPGIGGDVQEHAADGV